MLTDKKIEKFQEIYQKRYGKKISREEAYRQGASLLRLVELTYRPMSETEYQALQQRRRETRFGERPELQKDDWIGRP